MTRIVTHALCDLPTDLIQEHRLIIIPESIHLENEVVFTGRELSHEVIYEKMRNNPELPMAAHPNVSMYLDAFNEAGQDGGDIVCINMTSKMSGSYNTANIARKMLMAEGFDHEIFVVDSLELTHGVGFLAMEAVKMAEQGKGGAEIAQYIESIRDKIGIYFVLQSLENAKKGGRLGLIKARVAESLNIKPVLMFRDGIETDVKIAYSFRQALRFLPDYYKKRALRGQQVIVFHANNEPEANRIKDQILELDPEARVDIRWLAPSVGVYTGEGCVGIAFWEP